MVPIRTKPNLTVSPTLTGFGYEFEIFPILKHWYGMGNGDIGVHPEHMPKPVLNVENQFIAYFIQIEIQTLNHFTRTVRVLLS